MSNRENDCGICGNGNGTCPHNKDDLSKELDKIFSRQLRTKVDIRDEGDCPNCGRSSCICRPMTHDEIMYGEKKMSNSGAQGVSGIEGQDALVINKLKIQCQTCSQKPVCKFINIYSAFYTQSVELIKKFNEHETAEPFIEVTFKCKYYNATTITRK